MAQQFQNLIIFELANNHQGSISHANYIIDKLAEQSIKYKKYGFNFAVKLQYRDLDTFIHPDYKDNADIKHIPRFLSTRLSNDEFFELVKKIKSAGLITVCTPFDEISVELCEEHEIDMLKIASCSSNDWILLEKAAAVNKPLIISTGGKTLTQIDKIYNFLTHRSCDFAILHCVGLYPPQDDQVRLSVIDKMRNRYPNIPIGWSGHESPDKYYISQMALAKGAVIFERHVGHATGDIALNAYSTEVDNIDQWLDAINIAKEICNKETAFTIDKSEITSLEELARGCWAKMPISAGELVSPDKIFFAMPLQKGQTTSGEYLPIIKATRNYSIGEPIYEERPKSFIYDTRSIVHDIKGMLYEANVAIPNNFEMELSHHFGIEDFRNHGATIISIVNREYCKKVIVILPGQYHPVHYHKAKEETFHVLNGMLRLFIGGLEHKFQAGEIYTIERDVRHSFDSETGCIFEEISTTHIKEDSFYDDPSISKRDVLERKTILKNW